MSLAGGVGEGSQVALGVNCKLGALAVRDHDGQRCAVARALDSCDIAVEIGDGYQQAIRVVVEGVDRRAGYGAEGLEVTATGIEAVGLGAVFGCDKEVCCGETGEGWTDTPDARV